MHSIHFVAKSLGEQCSDRNIFEINKTETQLVVTTAKEGYNTFVRKSEASGKQTRLIFYRLSR